NVRITLDQTRLSISQEVRTALSGLRTAEARLATATAQVGFATEVERLARIRRDAGEATFLEVVDAQTQLVIARNAEVTARYDYLASFADLQRAVGRDDVATPLPEGFENPYAAAPRVGRSGDRTTTAPPAKPPIPGPLPPANKGDRSMVSISTNMLRAQRIPLHLGKYSLVIGLWTSLDRWCLDILAQGMA
ncbi:MAG: TolC family protein, partial [Oxalobacteraceae bacterium]